jgi:hypothetical protein
VEAKREEQPMTTKYVVHDAVREIEHKFVKRWVRGTGQDAEFTDDSIGYYVHFKSFPASLYLGEAMPVLRAGDQVKITLERA